MRTLRAVAAVFLMFLAARTVAAAPVPPGARLSLELDRLVFFLGENVLVHLVVENVGTVPFRIDLGGDYRGSTRHLRFSVEATDAQGKEVPDPNPVQHNMGGISYGKEIKPGEKHYESLPLLRYRRFERPGTYRLRVAHDFGWTEKDPSKFPSGRAPIKFVMPTPKQAREVVDHMCALEKDNGGTSGQKRPPFADFTTLIYPVYLPELVGRARGGDGRAFEALGAMPSPKATAELVRLLDGRDAALARKAMTALIDRLPDPVLKQKQPAETPLPYDYHHRRRLLVKASWRDEFAPAVRRFGRRLLADKDVAGLANGAYALECLGNKEDLGALAKALDRTAWLRKDISRNPCGDLMRAARAMARRDVRRSTAPRTTGELLLFVCAAGTSKTFRPAGWEAAFLTALRHGRPYVRETALENLPLPPPKGASTLLPRLLADDDFHVQTAACRVAERLKAPELREAVLIALRTAQDHWLLDAAGSAASALGADEERVRILAARLDEEAVAAWCLQALVASVLSDTAGYGSPTTVDAATGRACKKAWRRFLSQQSKALAAGKRFKLSDPAVPLAELFPKYTFYPR